MQNEIYGKFPLLAAVTKFVAPAVILKFGARS